MLPGNLFHWTMVDLEACTRSKWHYHQMRIAAQLRLLLLDTNEPPLFDQLQSAFPFELRFVIADYALALPPPPGPDALSFTRAPIDPLEFPGNKYPTAELSRPEFFARPICTVNGITVSVGDLIGNVAYVSGVVHAGKPHKKRAGDVPLLQLRRTLRIGGNFEIALHLLREIGRVTHRALAPLQILINDTTNRGRPIARFDYGGVAFKERAPDGSWTLHDSGHSYRLSDGRYDPNDPVDPARSVPPGRPYVQFEVDGQVWRAYGDAAPRVEHASADDLVQILARYTIRVGPNTPSEGGALRAEAPGS